MLEVFLRHRQKPEKSIFEEICAGEDNIVVTNYNSSSCFVPTELKNPKNNMPFLFCPYLGGGSDPNMDISIFFWVFFGTLP